ncbi:Rieske (2Fe-2S) protein [Aeoliella sp. ICT_H6.2]|uniref:Rieske (2Fe-2S) protein n=1 Tax=Aeoliella straminimaris TaxID=2954799 RepID=A0A9X2FH55_9BACT|nr:Rieske (2Fe-2S) protein [Aeoliella straminimaris]MCO6045666.1 Rieske (2Fe-2S) protein [Aeoliella straminimaris]
MSEVTTNTTDNKTVAEPRRSFGSKVLAALVGIGALLVPTAAGFAVLLDPVLKKRKQGGDGGSDDGNWIRVASLNQIPPDGVPRQFAVIDPKPIDKWNRYEPQSERPVLLSRDSEDETPMAISVTCPHLGCIVTYDAKDDTILCPCHNAVFDAEGKRLSPDCVSPRDLDHLEVRVDEQTGDVLVNYKRFKGGIAAQEAI